MNERLNNIMIHHNIPVAQRQALADDLFGLLNDHYDCDVFQDFLIGEGYMRSIEELDE